MKPLTLRMEGFRHYQAPQTVRFQDGCTAIVGSNGAGKSSILQAIEVALFGPDGRSLAPYVTWGHDAMTVELEFEHAGHEYRVRRSSQRGKHLLDLEVRCDHLTEPVYMWDPISRETVKETQAALEQLLGFTRSTLRASSLLMQGDASAWVDRDPRDRKQVLADVLGLDAYGRLLAEARARRQAAASELAEQRGRLTVLRDQAAPAAELRDRAVALFNDYQHAQDLLNEAEARALLLKTQVAEGEQRERERRDAQHQVDVLEERAVALRRVDLEATVAREKADTIRQEIARLERLAVELADVANRLAELDQAERARAEALDIRATHERDVERISAERDRLGRRIDELGEQRDALVLRAESMQEHEEPCDRCGQPLHDGARARAVASLMDEAKKINEEALELSATRGGTLYRDEQLARQLAKIVIPDPPEGLAGLRARFDELDEVPAQLAAARARLEAHDATIAAADKPEHQAARATAETDLTSARATLAQLEPIVVGLDEARTAHAAAARFVSDHRPRLDLLRAKTAETGALLELAENAAATAGTVADQVARLDRTVADLTELERGYGPNGIPLLILENVAVPAIEQHANEILARLALDYRVEIRTQTEKTDGTLRDALDVIVTTGQGEATFEQLSGSEKTRVAVALRVGLARLLAARRGADCRMLALDEPEGLDGTVRPLLVDVLRELEAGRVFDQVLLVSHESDLRDAFDQAIEVQRGADGWSHIVGGEDEAVAA